MQRSLLSSAFCCLVLLGVSPGHATTFYVSTTGNNTNSCSVAQNSTTARRTIAQGIACLSAGDTLLVKAGTYAEDLVDLMPSGSAGNPTILKNAPGETVVVAPISQPSNWLGGIFVTRDKNYITLDGFIFDMSSYTSVNAYVVEVFGPLDHHITIQNCEIRNATGLTGGAGASGFVVGAGSSFITMRNNKAHHVGPPTDNPSGPPAHGFYIGGATDSLFENNEAYGNQGYGFQMWTQYAGYSNSRNIVRNNRFHHNPLNAGALISSGTDIQVYNNLLYENRTGLQIGGYGFDTVNQLAVFNTIYHNAQACILLGSSGQNNVTGTIVRNTICRSNGTDGLVPLGGITSTADHNLLATDPLFVAPDSGDFTLSTGSLAINNGVTVSSVLNDFTGAPRGTPPEIGAYEFGLALAPGLQAQWRFDEGTGTSVGDTSGHGHAVTLTGTATWSPGHVGPTGLTLDGLTGIGTLTPAFDYPLYTWMTWVLGTNAPTTASNQKPLVNGSSPDTWGFSWSNTDAAFKQAVYHLDASGTYQGAALTTPLLAGVWYFVGATWDGAMLRVYLNGRLEASTVVTGLGAVGGDFTLGMKASNPATAFPGSLDHLQVYNGALTEAEVMALYRAQAGMPRHRMQMR